MTGASRTRRGTRPATKRGTSHRDIAPGLLRAAEQRVWRREDQRPAGRRCLAQGSGVNDQPAPESGSSRIMAVTRLSAKSQRAGRTGSAAMDEVIGHPSTSDATAPLRARATTGTPPLVTARWLSRTRPPNVHPGPHPVEHLAHGQLRPRRTHGPDSGGRLPVSTSANSAWSQPRTAGARRDGATKQQPEAVRRTPRRARIRIDACRGRLERHRVPASMDRAARCGAMTYLSG